MENIFKNIIAEGESANEMLDLEMSWNAGAAIFWFDYRDFVIFVKSLPSTKQSRWEHLSKSLIPLVYLIHLLL